MNTTRIATLAIALALTASVFGATTTFDDLGLDPDSFYNGADGAGQFVSGGFTFYNNYNATFGSWGGFAASTVTDNKTPGWFNQYAAVPGRGAGGSAAYGVGYYSTFGDSGSPRLDLPEGFETVQGLYVTNTVYTYYTVREGDAFTDPFGPSDRLTLFIWGLDAGGERGETPVEVLLADGHYILYSWMWVDLTPLGQVSGLEFTMTSTDVGAWGINTPTFFAIDGVTAIPEPATMLGLAAALGVVLGRRSGRGQATK